MQRYVDVGLKGGVKCVDLIGGQEKDGMEVPMGKAFIYRELNNFNYNCIEVLCIVVCLWY